MAARISGNLNLIILYGDSFWTKESTEKAEGCGESEFSLRSPTPGENDKCLSVGEVAVSNWGETKNWAVLSQHRESVEPWDGEGRTLDMELKWVKFTISSSQNILFPNLENEANNAYLFRSTIKMKLKNLYKMTGNE